MSDKQDARPRLLVSRCLGFDSCRYNGQMVTSPLVEALKGHAEFVDLCPEADIGLGIPRPPVRIVVSGGRHLLVQPETGADVTGRMETYVEQALADAGSFDGVILKARSPSCGIKDVKLYASSEPGPAVGRGQGLFGGAVLARFPTAVVEDELRLQNDRIREHFLTAVYTLARWRQAELSGRSEDLYTFHAHHKLLLMAYNQTALKQMGAILARQKGMERSEVVASYHALLTSALSRMPGAGAHINVLMHALGYVSGDLSPEEKALYLDTMSQYRANILPLHALTTLMRAWAVRVHQPYLLEQMYFAPYPPALAPQVEQGRGRTYWHDRTEEAG